MTEPAGDFQHLDQVVIERRFCGPPNSANGGYTCGRLAEYIDGPATVRLVKPPPLDEPMDMVRQGREIQLRIGEDLIARGWPSHPELEPPAAPPLGAARNRRRAFAGHQQHAFPGCFVCGVDREEGDGLLIHAGPDTGSGNTRHDVACTWRPHPSLCEDDGILPERYVWSALDCPGGWSFLSFGEEVALLGELSAEIHADLHCGQEYIVTGWEIDREGRKRRTGSALYRDDGTLVAKAAATWITIRQPGQ